jgi:hypothetical protein
MFIWTIDKFVRPRHAAAVFENFYYLSEFGDIILYVIGVVEMVIIIGFLLGIKKKFTYGVVLVLHGISTFSSYKQYLSPFEEINLLFFAAWPMLAACFALYYLRDLDTLWVVGK